MRNKLYISRKPLRYMTTQHIHAPSVIVLPYFTVYWSFLFATERGLCVFFYCIAGHVCPPEHGYPPVPSFPPVPPVYPPVPGCPAVPSYYHIRSRLNGLVLDVEGDNRHPGARIIMWNQKPGNFDNQLWYDDYATGTIRSKLNDFCLDWDGNSKHNYFAFIPRATSLCPLSIDSAK